MKSLTFRFLRRIENAALLAVTSLALLVGCQGGSTGSSGGSEEILIGHFGSMTGSEATFGESTDNGIKLAVDELNAAGGIRGKKVKLITYDDKGDAREAGTAVTRLINKDGEYLVKAESDDKGTVSVDATKTPKQMTIKGTEGPNKGKTLLAIYELSGDELQVCYDLSGKEFPKAFKTEAGQLLMYAVYKKVK